MKNPILNLLSFSALTLFFILATATSQEEDFGFYQTKIERTPNGIKITNEDDFDYENLNIILSTVDTFKVDSVVFKSFSPDNNPIRLKINESIDFLFSELKTMNDEPAADSLQRFSVLLSGTCPDHDFCEFSEIFR